MKVKIQQRSVYHKFAEVEIDVPKDIKEEDIQDYLDDNEHLYVDKIDKAISKAKYEYGFGLGDGMEDEREESEWRYECEKLELGGHL